MIISHRIVENSDCDQVESCWCEATYIKEEIVEITFAYKESCIAEVKRDEKTIYFWPKTYWLIIFGWS